MLYQWFLYYTLLSIIIYILQDTGRASPGMAMKQSTMHSLAKATGEGDSSGDSDEELSPLEAQIKKDKMIR